MEGYPQPYQPLHSNLSEAQDPEFALLIQTFVENLEQRLMAMESAGDRGDWTELARLAHQISGAAGSYGFPEISTAAAQIERVARRENPQPSDITPALATLDGLCIRAWHSL